MDLVNGSTKNDLSIREPVFSFAILVVKLPTNCSLLPCLCIVHLSLSYGSPEMINMITMKKMTITQKN